MSSSPYEVHAFVCLGGKACPGAGAEAIWAALKEGIGSRGLSDRVRVNKAGCMGQCGHGPMICVYPANVWYAGVTPEDLPALLDHLAGGKPHGVRLYRPEKPGANKA